MHNSLTIYYTSAYYTASTCCDTIVSSSGSLWSVPANLRKYVNAVLVIPFEISHIIFCCPCLKSLRI